MAVFVRDVTEQKNAEEKLKASEESYRTLIAHMQDGLVVGEDEEIFFANRALAEMTGYSIDELTSMNFYDLVAPEQADLIRKRFVDRAAGREVPKQYEIKLRKKDGKEMPVQAAQLQPRSKSVVRFIEASRKANPARPDPVARYVIFLVRTKGIHSWSVARQTCRDRMCKNGKIPLDGEGKLDLSMFGPS